MLLAAGPSQAAYPTTSHPVQYSPTVSRLTISSSSTVSKSNESVRSPQSTSTPSSNRFSFMKSISSQLNRGTELLKQTVQRAIFSKVPASLSEQQQNQQPPTTAKPTPYHCDPHAVTRSSSVDSLHLETCHIRPIRPYSLTPFRRGNLLSCPVVVRPDEEEVIQFNPIKVKARFKLQKGPEKSAFCSLGSVTEETSSAKARKSPKKSAVGRGAKRKRSLPEDDPEDESPAQSDTPSPAKRRGKKVAESSKKSVPEKTKAELKKTTTKGSAKRKSIEQEKQEKEDFELAKRLQKELNSSNETNGSVNGTTLTTRRTRNGRSQTNNSDVSSTSYSLRTTRSLSKFSLSSVSPALVLEEEPEQQQQKENAKKGVAGKKTSPAKNGLTTRNNITGRARKRIHKGENEEVKVSQKPPEISTSTKRTTRSKGSCRSTK